MKVDFSQYDPFFDNIEEYVNRYGATFGDKAETIERIANSIAFLYVRGIATESQSRNMNEKLMKEVKKNLKEIKYEIGYDRGMN